MAANATSRGTLRSTLLVCMLVHALGAFTQEKASLVLKEAAPLSGLPSGVFRNPSRCDSEGNIYLVAYQRPNPGRAPVTEISPEGQMVASFDLKAANEEKLKDAKVADFQVGSKYQVYLLANASSGEAYVLTFDDGKFSDTVALRLESHTFASKLAVFHDGQLLVSGSRLDPDSNAPTGEGFTAIFDAGGRMVKDLTLKDDASPEKHDASSKEAESDVTGAIDQGDAVGADDGNIYLFRHTANPIVYVVSPGGEVLRRLELQSPGRGYTPTNTKVSGGKIVVQFYRADPANEDSFDTLLSEFDSQTGDRVMDYTPGAEVIGQLACYSRDKFSFLGQSKGALSLIQASPR